MFKFLSVVHYKYALLQEFHNMDSGDDDDR